MANKKILYALAITCLALFLGTTAALAQSSELQLSLSRNFGFSMGKQIQGSFTIAAYGPTDLTSVTYLIDGKEMATVTQAPFRYSFSTDSYPLGNHQFSATAKTSSGQTLQSNVIDVEMVTASEGWQAGGRIALPLLGIVFLVILLSFGMQFVTMGKRRRYEPGAERNYGVSGGAICPRCGRPYARSFWSLHMMGSKLERCPYCGKWAFVRAASPEALRAAEQAELQGSQPTAVHEKTAEERLLEQIEESRMAR